MDGVKQQQVLSQYINQYIPIIDKTLIAIRENKENLHIPYAQFLFSVIDYYGLIYIAATKRCFNKRDKNNFLEFFASSYFPSADRCKSSFLYFLRNGIIHQIFPKASSIGTSSENKLFFIDKANGNIPALNLDYLDKIIISATNDCLNGASAGTPSNPASELLAALAGSIQGVTGGKFGMQQVQSSGVLGPGISDLLQRQTDQSTGSNRPKAFLNWVLLDEQFKIVNTSTGFEPVGADGEFKTFVKTGLPISQNGYLYVYTSNESPVDVFFDNLQVTHVRGPLLEETHYYPFGLTMAGTSSRAANTLENKRKWNKGSELESKEFSDGSGLELYSTFYRSLDPQLGRFWQIDPKPNYIESPYASMGNNPISYNDPLGDTLLTKADKRRADRIEKQINKTNSSLNKNVNNWKAQIAAAKAKGNASIANSLQGNVNDANARITANNTTLDNLNAIREDPTQAYTFNQLTTDSKIGGTMLKTMSVNGSNQNVIVMSVLSDDNAVHELTHAFQGGIKRMFSFNLNNELYPVSFRGATFFAQGINANAEVAAYQAQYGFNPGSMPSSTWGGTPSSINYINAFYVGGINQPGTTSPVYENVRDMVNTFMQFLRSY